MTYNYYVIQQGSRGRGLFSLISAVICNLDFAETKALIPVVDFENYKTVYNETALVNGTLNSWEYFFEPVSNVTLAEVYNSNQYIISSNSYPSGYDYTIANDRKYAALYRCYRKYIRLQPHVLSQIDNSLLNMSMVLGVHFRGREMRTASRHWYPPSPKQMIAAIELMLELNNYKSIFVSSEDYSLITLIEKAFPGQQVIHNENYFRVTHGNAYKIYPRKNHFYKLGLEVLSDMYSLSRCSSLISCSSNVAWFARFINNGMYKRHLFINNGPNFGRLNPLHLVSWKFKSFMPRQFFGFKTDPSSFQWVSQENHD